MPQDVRSPPSIVTVPDAPTDPAAFLRWASGRPREEGRYELSRGVVTRTMINVTRTHSDICINLVLALGRQLDLDAYRITSTDFAVKTAVGIRGPDVMVETRSGDMQSRATEKPILLVEVLSPSTAGIDFTEKRDEYLPIPTLQTYLICASDAPRVWAWRREEGGTWPAQATLFETRSDIVSLAGLGVDLPLAQIFRGVP